MNSEDPSSNSARHYPTSVIAVCLVVALCVGVALGVLGAKAFEREPAEPPLDVTAVLTQPHSGFSLVVPEVDDLAERLGPRPAIFDDCDQLWRVGMELGATPVESGEWLIVLHGNAPEGVVITDLRAIKTRSLPTVDGALFTCPHQVLDDVPFFFTFEEGATTVSPERRGDSGTWINPFEHGEQIRFPDGQNVLLETIVGDVTIPGEGYAWHLEADVTVGDQKSTLIIDNDGEDFVHTAMKDDYPLAYGGGSQVGGDWLTPVSYLELRELPPPQ